MDYADIIARIAAAINDDEVAAITGPVGNGILNDMVAELGEGYQFAGILTPTSNPVRTDARLWALAMTPGKYYNLDGRVLADGQVAVFMWGGGWSSVVLSVTTAEAVCELLSQFMDATTADAEVGLKADELTPVMPPMVTGSARGILGRSAAARFLYRQTSSGSGAAWLRAIHGRTVSYNQLFNGAGTSATIPSGHKYYLYTGGAGSVATSTGAALTAAAADDMLVDLTQAGLDSIITTPEQFEAWQMEQFGHKGYLGYTPGELVSVNPTGIKTTTPGGDEHTLPLDFTEHFATGMNGLNGIFDEVVSDENGKFTDGEKRFGIVDLGDLTWSYTAGAPYNWFVGVALDNAKANNSEVANFITPAGYAHYSFNTFYVTHAQDEGIAINAAGRVIIRDYAYTDAATFKAAMSGVPLVYELATPQHVTFTDPSDAVYPVTEGGTEQVLPVNGSEPTTIAPDFQMQAPLRRGYDTPTDATFDNFLEALGQHLGKTIAKEWDAETQTYQFDIL